MARSLAEYALRINGDTTGLQSAMTNAQRAVAGTNAAIQRTAAGIGNVQSVAQQAVFAVDDFVTSFSTGGLAGGLRGAGNNLTFMAAQLGSIKAQLAIVAAIAATQLAIKFWDDPERKKVEKAREEIDKYRESFRRLAKDIEDGTIKAPDALGIARRSDIGGVRDDIASNTARRRALDSQRIQFEQLLRQAQSSTAGLSAQFLKTGDATAADKEALRTRAQTEQQISDSISQLLREVAAIDSENAALKNQESRLKAVADARQRLIDMQFEVKPFVTNEDRAITKKNLEDTVREIEDLQDRIANGRRTDISLFGRFPGAAAFGSSAAISSINAAQFGAQNLQSSVPQETRQMARDIARLRQLEEQRKGQQAVLEIIDL